MIIELSDLKVGESLNFDQSEQLDGDILTREGKFLGEARVKGVVTLFSENEAILDGTVDYSLETPCDSCGTLCTKNYSVRLTATFSGTPEEDGYYFDGITLDVTKAVADSVILDIPSRIVCREDCLGVCPTCGQNLNEGKCNCESGEKGNNPFAALKQIDFSSGGAQNGSTKE